MDGPRHDRRDLHRGVAINTLGAVLRLLQPVLLLLVVRAYGPEAFGVFTALQAALFLALRGSLLGLDKAVLWWLAQQDSERERVGLRPAIAVVTVSSTLTAVGLATLGAPLVAAWADSPAAADQVRLMAAGLVPMALLELLLHAVLAKRRVGAQVLVRDVAVSSSFAGVALTMWAAGHPTLGLAAAFVTAQLAGAVGAWIALRRALGASRWPQRDRLPRRMLRYAAPMWLSEAANTTLLRLDVYVLAALTDPHSVGIYAAALQVANALRSIRRAFDPIVLAILARRGGRRELPALFEALDHATSLVLYSQAPVLAAVVVGIGWLMPLFGPGFESAAVAAVILSTLFFASGALGLNGLALLGLGRTDLTLANVAGAMALQGALLLTLVPAYGLNGAAAAVGIAALATAVAQLLEVRVVTGRWPYRGGAGRAVRVVARAGVALAVVWAAVPSPAAGLVGLTVAVAVLTAGVVHALRSHRRAIPSPHGCTPRSAPS